MFYRNLLDSIGQTPMLRIKNFITASNLQIFAKLEGQNPGGSIKDRAAIFILKQAEKKGFLKPGMTILEATSGNMGIALAMIGAQMGYPVKIVMSAAVSLERRVILKSLGADLLLSDPSLGTAGALTKARSLAARNKQYFFVDQFNNPDNVAAHYHGIARELLVEVGRVDFLIAGIGTGGTLIGIAQRFKQDSPQTKIIAAIPPAGYKIQGIQNPRIDFQGKILDLNLVDQEIAVSIEETLEASREFSRKEGLLVGMSSGAILAALRKLTGKINNPAKIVILLPDRGEKYLSTDLYQ